MVLNFQKMAHSELIEFWARNKRNDLGQYAFYLAAARRAYSRMNTSGARRYMKMAEDFRHSGPRTVIWASSPVQNDPYAIW